MTVFTRPLPVPSPESLPFWAGCREEILMMQYCKRCNRINWFPRAYCYNCASAEFDWRPALGTATLETYSIVRRAMNDAWKSEVPYTLAMVRLSEGIRMITRLIHVANREPRIDGPVRVCFQTLNEQFKLPFFEEIRE